MYRFCDLKTAFSKILIPVAVLVFIVFSFSVSTFAETTELEFVMEEEPVFIDEKSTDEIIEFYENATRESLFSAETNTFVKRNFRLTEHDFPSEWDLVVHTFRVTDIDSVKADDVSDFASEIIDDVFLELTTSLGRKFVSTLIHMYTATYEVTYDPETNEISEVLLHIALVVGDGFDKIDELIETYIRPNADAWREYTPAKQIIELNNFILDGKFQYDVNGEQRKSIVQFVSEGKGVCEEYAGLTSLFLDELGFENILVRGYALVDKERVDHVWNLVNLEGNWYHLDILWNGPTDENGIHVDITTDYLLKSTKTVKADHLTLSVYYSYTEKALADYDLSEYMYNGDIVTPQMKLDMAKEELAVAIDAAFDVCFRNSWKYTSESIDKIMPVYTDAKAIYDDVNSTIEQVEAQTALVTSALEAYVEIFVEADKTNLYKSLSQAYTYMLYDYALYTSASLKALVEPYDAAVLVYQDPYATQSEVDAARSNLRKYINRLEKIPVEEPEVEPEIEPDNNTTETPVNPDSGESSESEDSPIVVTPLPEEDPPEVESPEVPDTEIEPEGDTSVDEEPESAETDPVDPEDPIEDENIEVDAPVVNEDPIIDEEPEKDPENDEEKVPVIPSEPKSDPGFNSDIILYIVVALIALGGIVYLVVSKICSKDDDEEEAESSDVNDEQISSETEVAPVITETEEKTEETVENSEDKTETVENTEKAEESIKEESSEENKSEEKAEDKTEEAKSESEEKTEAVEPVEDKTEKTEAKTEEVKEEKTEEVKSESEEKIEAVEPVEDKTEKTEAKTEEVKEEKTEEAKSESEEKTEAVESVEDKTEKTDANTEEVKEEKTEEVAPDVVVIVEPVEEKTEETEVKIEDVKEDKTEEGGSEVVAVVEPVKEKAKKAEAKIEEVEGDLSSVEIKNQEKASMLLKYFKAKNKKLKEKADKE